MAKDPRFKTAGYLLVKKQITYKKLFDHLPASVVRQELGITSPKMQKIKNNPGHWTLSQIYAMAEKLEIPVLTLFKLIDESI